MNEKEKLLLNATGRICAFQNEIRTCIKTENMKFMQITIPCIANLLLQL